MVGGIEAIISRLKAGSDEQMVCAQWRHEAFLKDDGMTVADSYGQLQSLTTRRDDVEVALVAHVEGKLAGICLLVLNEIDPLHDVSPWLASLYVDPPFRRRGMATTLIRAIEAQARRNGTKRLYLYTVDAERLYRSCGWMVEDRKPSHDATVTLMSKELGPP